MLMNLKSRKHIYIDRNKKTFALVQNITTVSKIRIKKPVNQGMLNFWLENEKFEFRSATL